MIGIFIFVYYRKPSQVLNSIPTEKEVINKKEINIDTILDDKAFKEIKIEDTKGNDKWLHGEPEQVEMPSEFLGPKGVSTRELNKLKELKGK